jgi:hypothetical protein
MDGFTAFSKARPADPAPSPQNRYDKFTPNCRPRGSG